jgi:hypothetical protein
MNTRRWVVLVPHRDIAPHLEKRRAALFTAGLAGAFSLPAVIPLAVTERPLSGDELKALARQARAALGGRMLEAGPWQSAGAGGITVYGPSYTLPHLAFPGQLQICNCSGKSATVAAELQLVLCAAVLAGNDADKAAAATAAAGTDNAGLSFRAAALANFCFKDAGFGEEGYSFRWKMGPLCWLPKPAGKQTGRAERAAT